MYLHVFKLVFERVRFWYFLIRLIKKHVMDSTNIILGLVKELGRRIAQIESKESKTIDIEKAINDHISEHMHNLIVGKIDNVLEDKLDTYLKAKLDTYMEKVVDHDHKITEMKKNIVTVSTMKMEAYVEDRVKMLQTKLEALVAAKISELGTAPQEVPEVPELPEVKNKVPEVPEVPAVPEVPELSATEPKKPRTTKKKSIAL